MKNFNRSNRSNRGGRGFDSGRSSMYQAICSQCGARCEVPFKPTGDKPIYCDSCFSSKKTDSPRPSRRDFNRRDAGRAFSMHQAVCDECGKPCQVPFKPTGDKPIYCDDCFSSKRDKGRDRSRNVGSRGDKGADQFKDVLNSINTKLDQILKAMVPQAEQPKSADKEVKEKKVSTKKTKPEKVAKKQEAKPKQAVKKIEAKTEKAETGKKTEPKKAATKKNTKKKK